MPRIIHGLAMPFNEWIVDPAITYSMRLRPGAYTDAITRTDQPMRLTCFDHAYSLDQWETCELASVAAGTLRYWEEPHGLMFEATLGDLDPNGRVYQLIKRAWVTRCCLDLGKGDFPVGAQVEILRMPHISDLALLLIGTAHARGTYVRIGPAPAPLPFTGRPRPDLEGDHLLYRLVAG